MTHPNIVNIADIPDQIFDDGPWHSIDKPLTPALAALPGRIGMTLTRVSPGKTACPFHTHQLDDEIFYILSGGGVFRYGDAIHPIKPGDCVSCPAGTGNAHQLANNGTEDLVYLSIGANSLNEVATYPDSGKIMVRALKTIGTLTPTDYATGEPAIPRIFNLASKT